MGVGLKRSRKTQQIKLQSKFFDCLKEYIKNNRIRQTSLSKSVDMRRRILLNDLMSKTHSADPISSEFIVSYYNRFHFCPFSPFILSISHATRPNQFHTIHFLDQ